MTLIGRALAIAGLLVALAAGIGAIALERGWFELPLDELAARYQLPDSRFIDVDGVRVHYVDRGSGPAVVLLHASYLNLRSWDPVSDELDDRYRVIRLDLSGAGLTGPDPTQGYGIERNIEFVQALITRLALTNVSLVGTSSGGIVAFRFAALHPEQVDRLVLINSAGMPRTAATNPLRPQSTGLTAWVEARLRSRRFWAESLRDNFVPPHEPSAELVTMTYDMNRRAGGREVSAAYLKNFRTGDPQQMLARVRAPTLILWGLDNRTLMHLEADVFAHWLTGAQTLVRKYPGLGHYPYLEDPGLLARDVGDFLSHALDAGLRPAQCGVSILPEEPSQQE